MAIDSHPWCYRRYKCVGHHRTNMEALLTDCAHWSNGEMLKIEFFGISSGSYNHCSIAMKIVLKHHSKSGALGINASM